MRLHCLLSFLQVIISIINVKSNCNYVHNHESDTVYATDVCMQMSSTSHYYSKFECNSDSSLAPNISV